MSLCSISDYAHTSAAVVQNKCNVGYAFINMVDASHIISLYEVCFVCQLVAKGLQCSDFLSFCIFGFVALLLTRKSFAWQTFNGKRWEKFNSEKVASLAYARIQGKAALVAHFQNSSLMNEDKRCRPILFHSDGPNAGDQVSV